jgi:hypothetical protein
MKTFASFEKSLNKFFFEPASPLPIAGLRIGLSFTLLLQAALVGSDVFQLYGQEGWLQGTLGDFFSGGALPSLGSVARGLGALGVSDHTVILSLSSAYVVSLLGLLLGYRARLSAGVAWALHLLIIGGHVTSYGVDQYANVFLFYLILAPAGAALSLDKRWGRVRGEPSSAARFFLRTLQLHLCLTYFFAGADKAVGAQWWNGEAVWRALMLPMYCPFDFSWLANFPWLAKLGAWSTLVVEIGYSFFIWSRRTRPVWIAAVLGMHFGIALFMGLGTFSLAMSLFTISLFAVPADALPKRDVVTSPFKRIRSFQPVLSTH